MEIIVLGSSSEGNCYLLKNDKECLIIECGVPFSDVMKALNFNVRSIVGALVSHRHNDHAGYISQYTKRAIPVYTNNDVIESQGRMVKPFCHEVKARQAFSIGRFKIMPLDVLHDVPCFAYIINHDECGTILFITDCCGFKYNVPNVSHVMIECNYADDILEESIQNGIVLPMQRTRLLKTHMEFETTKLILSRMAKENMQDVVLIHLSSNNSHRERFVAEIEKLIGLPTYAAKPNLKISL